jgi:hypothetical protein
MSKNLNLGNPGKTFEEYKQFITELLKKLNGKEPTSTDAEWQEDYKKYLAKLKEKSK